MHKLSIYGLLLVTLLFLGATTSSVPNVAATDKHERYDRSYEEPYQQPYEEQSYEEPYQQPYDDSYDDSYGNSYDNMYSKYPTKDKKFVCKYGPLEGVFVKDKKFCDKVPPPTPENDAGLQCEECIKYWSHTLNQGQFRTFINDLAEYINSINFDFTPSTSQPHTTCSPAGPNANPNDDVICLPIAANNAEQNLAQVYEICEQLELALEWIVSNNTKYPNVDTITEAFEDVFAPGFLALLSAGQSESCTPEGGNQECRTAIGLLECLNDKLIPILQEEDNQPIQGGSSIQQTQDSPITAQGTEDLSAQEDLMNILLHNFG
jgi:hypothetical protein